MTESLAPTFASSLLASTSTSTSEDNNSIFTEDQPAVSSSLQMNRTGSAEVPTVPESPLATGKSAAAPCPLLLGRPSSRSAATGIAPSPLISISQRSVVGGPAAAGLTPPLIANQRSVVWGSVSADVIPSPLIASQRVVVHVGGSDAPLIQVEDTSEDEANGVSICTSEDNEEEALCLSGLVSSRVNLLTEKSNTNLVTADATLTSSRLNLLSDLITADETSSSSRVNLLADDKSSTDDVLLMKSKSSADFVPLTSSDGRDTKSAIDLIKSGRQTMADVKRKRTEVQITTFTNWVNDRLKVGKHERKVEDLFVDLNDGMLLIKLLENLTKKKVTGFTGKKPKTEAHKIVNLDLAFQFMQSENIKMIGVGGLNIYQGDITLTLGMIWTLIQKYQIRIHGYKVSTKHVMIQWVQALLPKWNITNLTSDWRDGRALIAVINAVKPGIAPDVANLDPSKHRQNCVSATKIANSYLKVPKLISPDDLCSGGVDELSLMTYLSYFVEPFRVKLLKRVQKVLPQFSITGFSDQWYSGRAFGAILEACFPGVSIYSTQLETSPPGEYTDELIKTVKKKLGINPPFESMDLVSGKVEELQIMTMILLISNGKLASLPDEIAVYGSGILEANFHKETSFVIDTSGAGPGQLDIDAYYEDNGKQLKFTLTEKNKQEQAFCLTYTPIFTSDVIFDVTWSDTPIPGSPFTVPVTDSMLINIIDFESHDTLVEAGKPLSLLFEARKAGHGHLNGYLQYGREKIHAVATKLPNGNFRLDFTPPKCGNPVLRIFWNKEEIHHLAITYTVVDIGGYSLESFPKNKIYRVFEEPEFCILTEKGLPLDVLQMTAVLSLDVQIPIKFTSSIGNRGHASFTPTVPGVYQVEVVCVDQLIKGSPFSVKVTDPHSCKVRGEIPSFLEIRKPYIFEIDVKEAGVGSITFASSDHHITSLFETQLKPFDSTDLRKLEVTPLVEGDYVVGIKYQNQWISNSPFRVQICDPTKFEVVEKSITGNVGKPIEFTIKAKERCDGALKPLIKATGPSAKYSPQVQLSEDGLQYSVKFVPWEIGNHEISITYGAFDIPSSPISLPVILFDSNACSASGSGLQKAYTNIPAQFIILGNQAGLIDDGTLSLKVASVIGNEECRIRVRDNKDGTYSIAYLVQRQGAYLISILTSGKHIPGSPFKLNALLGPEAQKCKMYGPALEEGMILMFGKPIDFTVDTSAAGTGKLSVKAIGPEGVPARVYTAKTDKRGMYDINVDALCHGKHRVSVKWSGQHIPCSPFMIRVFPGADARKCLAQGPGLEDGWVGKKSSFTIETKNAGAGILKVRLHGIKDAFKIEIAPIDQKNRRTLLANYNPTRPGEYLITIKWSEIHVPGSPFRVKVTGDGTNKTMIFTPTPRLSADMSPFVEDDDEDYQIEDSKHGAAKGIDHLRAIKSAPLLRAKQLTFKHGAKEIAPSVPSHKMITFSSLDQLKKQNAKASKSRRGSKKNEFDGQATVRVTNPSKKKLKKKLKRKR